MYRLLFMILSYISQSAYALEGKVVEQGAAPDRGRYVFSRTEQQQGGETQSLIQYKTLNGQLLVEESAVYNGLKLKKYVLKQFQIKEEAGVTIEKSKAFFYVEKKSGRESAQESITDAEDSPELFLTVDQIWTLVSQEWVALVESEKTISFQLAIPFRKEFVGFKLFKEEEKKNEQGEELVVFKLKPAAFLVALFVNPIEITFNKKSKKLLQVKGRLPIKRFAEDGDYSDIEGVLSFLPVSK